MKVVKRILICRSDNLGDVLVSLPAIEMLRLALPEAELALLAKKSNLNLLRGFLKNNRIRPISLEDPWEKESWDGFLSLFSSCAISAKSFLKRIPIRFGAYSKAWSFVFFNSGKRQIRSNGSSHEGAYSIELVREFLMKMGIQVELSASRINLPVEPTESELADALLRQLGISSGDKFVVIHPGMSGSALNLSSAQYEQIIQMVMSKTKCLVSVGPSAQDRMIWSCLQEKIPGLTKIEGVELSVLKEVFRKSLLVIAPSTGPLHLAHLVGVPVIGIYSPVQAHHPSRWGPWGGEQKAIILYPQVSCPGKRSCLGSICPEFNCMEKIDWASLILKELDGLT
ncbi:MAG: glycosyltransferase family 9 protein [Pseudomonadota bacterium]